MPATKTWSISLPVKLEKQAERAAKEENRSKSELIQEALRRYLESRQLRKLQVYGARKAKQLRITREEDVDRLVHEYRSESQ